MSKIKKNEKVITKKVWWTNKIKVSFILAIITFLVYGNSLTNGFILDDSLVITKNQYTIQGISGIGDIFTHDTFSGYYKEDVSQLKIVGGRYRPLSVAFFAILYQVVGVNSTVFHLWNLLLYALCCGILYLVLCQIFEPSLGAQNAALLGGLASAIFSVHPIHTEVVNNIKSNDEIWCLLLSLSSLHFSLKYWDNGLKKNAIISGLLLFIAYFAKENAIAFLAIIPITLFFRQAPKNKYKTGFLPIISSLGIGFILYFIIRYAVLGWSLGEAPLDLINNPFIKYEGGHWVHCASGEKLAMTFFSLGKYLQLLVAPISLSADYYPRYIDVITFANLHALASLLAYLALGVFVVYKLIKRQFGPVAYGTFFFLVSLLIVSNLIFPIGTNLAERFAFMPSVGFCIAVVGLTLPYFINPKSQKTALSILGAILLLFSFRTLVRNFDYESNMSLYSKDIKVAENSAKAQNALGALIAEEALNTTDPSLKTKYSNEALIHLNKALEIHPTYLEAFYMRGNVNYMLGKVEEAVNDYRQCLVLNPEFKNAYGNYALALRDLAKKILESNGDTAKAIKYLEESLKLYPNEQETAKILESAKAKQTIPSGN